MQFLSAILALHILFIGHTTAQQSAWGQCKHLFLSSGHLIDQVLTAKN